TSPPRPATPWTRVSSRCTTAPWRTRPPTPASSTSPPSRSSNGVTDMPAVSRSVFTDSIAAAGTITAHQAVGWDGNVASAAGNVAGFACTDAASGEVLAIDQPGTTVARAVQAASGDGAEFEVFIIPN